MSLLKDLIVAITSKPYQAFPLFAVGLVECGCGTQFCIHALDDDVISFQVGLGACGDELVCHGDMTPIFSGTNTSSGATIADVSKEFIEGTDCGEIQVGAGCSYKVRNITTGTYAYVTVVVNATTLTVSAAIFTAINQLYEIYPWHADDWTFNGTNAQQSVSTADITQCNIGLVDNRFYVMSYDVVTTAAVTMEAELGGDSNIKNTSPDAIPAGTYQVGIEPQVFSDDDVALNFGDVITLDNVSVKQYSTVGIRIKDCDGNILLDDSTNSHGWITYKSGFFDTLADARAQVDIDWPETGLGLGCFQICLYDLCSSYAPGFEPCILESYSLSVIDDASEPSCGLKIEWTNNEDFEIENGDYLDYPQYPSAQYTQRLRTDGSLRFVQPVNDDHTIDTQSDGLREVVHSALHETYELQLRAIPAPIHQALFAGLRHDVFSVNDVLYVWADGEYQIKWQRTADIASVVVKLIPQYSKGENVA